MYALLRNVKSGRDCTWPLIFSPKRCAVLHFRGPVGRRALITVLFAYESKVDVCQFRTSLFTQQFCVCRWNGCMRFCSPLNFTQNILSGIIVLSINENASGDNVWRFSVFCDPFILFYHITNQAAYGASKVRFSMCTKLANYGRCTIR